MKTAVIQEDLLIEGNRTTKYGADSIGGKVVGDNDANEVEVLPSGSVNGRITAESVRIAGTLEGSVKCKVLTLGDSSVLKADTSAETMTVSSGAKVLGHVEAGISPEAVPFDGFRRKKPA